MGTPKANPMRSESEKSNCENTQWSSLVNRAAALGARQNEMSRFTNIQVWTHLGLLWAPYTSAYSKLSILWLLKSYLIPVYSTNPLIIKKNDLHLVIKFSLLGINQCSKPTFFRLLSSEHSKHFIQYALFTQGLFALSKCSITLRWRHQYLGSNHRASDY